MSKIFLGPAIRLMERLRFTGKFAVVVLVLLIVVSVLVFLLFDLLNQSIADSRGEVDGIKVVQPLIKAVQFVQQHRGLSALVVGGKKEKAEELAAKTDEVDQSLAQTEKLLPEVLRNKSEWNDIRKDWQNLAEDGLKLELSMNIAAHTRLIAKLLPFAAEIADHYRLTQDPQIGCYYLASVSLVHMPVLLETLGRMRASGAGVLQTGKLPPQQNIVLHNALASINDLLMQYKLGIAKTKQENPDLAAELDESMKKLLAEVDRLTSIVREDILGQKFMTPAVEYVSFSTATINLGYTQIFEVLLPTLKLMINQRIDRLQNQMLLLVLMIGFMLLLVAYLVAGMHRSVMVNISRLVTDADAIASGDLTTRIKLSSRDELAEVGDSFNRMALAMSGTLRNVLQSSDSVSTAAAQTATSSSEIALSSQRQSDSVSSMLAAVEQTTASIDQINSNARNACELSERSGEISRRGGKLVQQVVTEMGEISAAVTASSQVVEELGRRSEEISSIIGLIKEIAEQTNLLALNAAIEAARAGQRGLGFAVVADEVRKLAERSGKSTQQIALMISSVQSDTRSAVEAMKVGVKRVEAGVELSSQAGEVMVQIRDGSERVVEIIREISDALREQASASSDIARDVETIAQMADQNTVTVAETHRTAEELKKLSSELQAEVTKFRVN